MNTDKLIGALSADGTQDPPPLRMLLWALLAGAAVSATLFFVLLGPRPDFAAAMHSWRFVFKLAVTLALAASAVPLLARAANPQSAREPADAVLAFAPFLLLVAVVVEFANLPQAAWMPRLIGHNARICMLFIPLLSLGPLTLLLLALRSGAPASGARAGALAGSLAGGLGAAFYAAHCPDDSPFFVAVWYSIAIAFVALLGASIGRRVLRW